MIETAGRFGHKVFRETDAARFAEPADRNAKHLFCNDNKDEGLTRSGHAWRGFRRRRAGSRFDRVP